MIDKGPTVTDATSRMQDFAYQLSRVSRITITDPECKELSADLRALLEATRTATNRASEGETVLEGVSIFALREAMVLRVREDGGDYNDAFDNGVRAAVAAFDAALRSDALTAKPASEPTRWQSIETAPAAVTVLAARFDDSFGEWIYGVVLSPPSHPFTHWRPLPEPPALAREQSGDAPK